MLLISFETNLTLTWPVNYVISNASEAKIFIIVEPNLHIKVVE